MTRFAAGEGRNRAKGELQSAAWGRRRTARLKESQYSHGCMGSGRGLRRPQTSVKRVAGLRWREAAARAVLRTADLNRVVPPSATRVGIPNREPRN